MERLSVFRSPTVFYWILAFVETLNDPDYAFVKVPDMLVIRQTPHNPEGARMINYVMRRFAWRFQVSMNCPA